MFGGGLVGFMGTGASSGVNAVTYNGTTDWLSRASAFTGGGNSGVGLFSIWVNRNSVAGNEQHTLDMTGSGGRYSFAFTQTATSDKFFFYAQSGANVYFITGSTNITPASGWTNILIQWDHNQATGSRVLRMYVDDVLETNTVNTNSGAAFTINMANITNIKVAGSIVGTTNNFNGSVAGLYFAPGQTLDLTNSANRAKFISGGKWVDLGANGELPTGVAPLLYLPERAATVNINRGTGGDMVLSGSPVDSPTTPAD